MENIKYKCPVCNRISFGNEHTVMIICPACQVEMLKEKNNDK